MNSHDTQIEILDKAGRVVLAANGSKIDVARRILVAIEQELRVESRGHSLNWGFLHNPPKTACGSRRRPECSALRNKSSSVGRHYTTTRRR